MKLSFTEFKQALCASPSEWNSYANDKLTIGYICALVNSGIATINEHNQIRIKTQYRQGE
jgi:hypothetical protein